MFVDRVEVTLKAGDGGNGAVSFRHEKFIARGGPDGGDGGDGGDIILEASPSENTLANFRYKKLLKAQNGQPGSKRRRHGKSGSDLIVKVPIGTVVSSLDNQLADLTESGQKIVIARGGKGGFGNAHFASSTRQAPRVAEKGEKGQEIKASLEMKMIADVGLVGLPNAGKSTLLSVVSNAHPEIADYAFTTLRPNLGVVDIEGHSLLFADIPGLIEGASQGKGLGDEFLRHVERTNLLLHLVDFYSQDIVSDYRTIIQELKDYKIDLSKRPQVVVLTKIEGADKTAVSRAMTKLKKIVGKATPVMAVSSQSGQGIKELLRETFKQYRLTNQQKTKSANQPKLPVIGLAPSADQWNVQKIDDGFLVTGLKIERFAQRTNFGDYHAEQRLRDILHKMGIRQELERQGIEAGQAIIIGQPTIGQLDY